MSCSQPAIDALHRYLSQVGGGIKRASRKSHAPRRPREGWGLVVTPLGETTNPLQQVRSLYRGEAFGAELQVGSVIYGCGLVHQQAAAGEEEWY